MYNRIEALCKEAGTNITEMCKATGVGRATLTELKKGRSLSLSTKNAQKIADYFGVSLDYILTGSEPSSAEAKVTDTDLKVALFGGDGEVTDEMWEEVLQFAQFVKQKREEKK